MAVIKWPVGLPCFQGWNEVFEDNMLRTDMSVGEEKRRLRYSRQRRQFTTQLTIPSAEFQTIKKFYQDELKQGINWFELKHPITDEDLQVYWEGQLTYNAISKNWLLVPLVFREK